MANLKIKVIDPQKLIFALEEPGQIGDTFCLKDLNTIDFSEWNQDVLNLENQEINKKIKNEAEKIELQIEKKYQNQINNFALEIQKIKNEKELLATTLKQEKENAILQLKNDNDNLINKIKSENNTKITTLNNELENIKQNFNIELLNQIKTKEIEFNNIKHNLEKEKMNVELEKDKIIQSKENQINNIKYEFEKEKINIVQDKDNIIQSKDNEINILKDKIDALNRNKNLLSTKGLGEELEQWCNEQYHSIMGNVADDCSFEKANTIYDNEGNRSRTGNKADFIFSVYDRPIYENNKILLGTVTLEMKTGTENSEKKNISFLPKLHQDMLNTKADFGILVTELEPETPIIINKAPGYNNIFIVRPTSMVPLLTILRSVILKQKDVKQQEIIFRDSLEILEQWNSFKDDIINKTLKNINVNLETINSSLSTARTALDKIQEAHNKLLNTHIRTFINKIENFKIDKTIIKKIDNIKTNQQHQLKASDQAISESEEVIVKEHKQIG